jgi:hypothetical protein
MGEAEKSENLIRSHKGVRSHIGEAGGIHRTSFLSLIESQANFMEEIKKLMGGKVLGRQGTS